VAVIRKRLSLEKEQALSVFFANNKLQQNEKLMSQVFQECRDPDGFLYCKYASYEVYGQRSDFTTDEPITSLSSTSISE
jgi:hypothetical protein